MFNFSVKFVGIFRPWATTSGPILSRSDTPVKMIPAEKKKKLTPTIIFKKIDAPALVVVNTVVVSPEAVCFAATLAASVAIWAIIALCLHEHGEKFIRDEDEYFIVDSQSVSNSHTY